MELLATQGAGRPIRRLTNAIKEDMELVKLAVAIRDRCGSIQELFPTDAEDA